MNFKWPLFLLLAFRLLVAPPFVSAGSPQKKDYLSEMEADIIRYAQTV